MANNTCTKTCESYVFGGPNATQKICVESCKFKDSDGRCYESCIPYFTYQRAMGDYTLCINDLDRYVIFNKIYLLEECPVGYKPNSKMECEMQTCHNNPYHQQNYNLKSCPENATDCEKHKDECVDYCRGGLFKQLENSDQLACVDACEDVSVEVHVNDQIYKKCVNLRCKYTETPLMDLV